MNISKLTTSLEDKLLRWIHLNRRGIVLYLALVMMLSVLKVLPYVNLYFSETLLLFLLALSFLIVFRVSVKNMILLTIFLFLLSLPLVLISEFQVAETLAEFSYGIFFLATIKTVLESAGREK